MHKVLHYCIAFWNNNTWNAMQGMECIIQIIALLSNGSLQFVAISKLK